MYIRILKALADESRLRIINLLYEGELCVCDLEHSLKIPQANVSRHLTVLKNAGLTASRKQAQWVYYRMNENRELRFIDELISGFLRQQEAFKTDLINFQKKGREACQSIPKVILR
jgi:ArsR family transcriptional regulator, arsenate/arsenite/antimonite-responsive transcriptional repressor